MGEERKGIRFERISIRSVCYRKEVLRGDVHRLDLLDRGLLVPDGLVGECRRRHGSHSTGSDGPDVPRRRHQHPRSDHQRDSRAERIRRHGRVELGWQQHLRRDRWVSVARRPIFPTNQTRYESRFSFVRLLFSIFLQGMKLARRMETAGATNTNGIRWKLCYSDFSTLGMYHLNYLSRSLAHMEICDNDKPYPDGWIESKHVFSPFLSDPYSQIGCRSEEGI